MAQQRATIACGDAPSPSSHCGHGGTDSRHRHQAGRPLQHPDHIRGAAVPLHAPAAALPPLEVSAALDMMRVGELIKHGKARYAVRGRHAAHVARERLRVAADVHHAVKVPQQLPAVVVQPRARRVDEQRAQRQLVPRRHARQPVARALQARGRAGGGGPRSRMLGMRARPSAPLPCSPASSTPSQPPHPGGRCAPAPFPTRAGLHLGLPRLCELMRRHARDEHVGRAVGRQVGACGLDRRLGHLGGDDLCTRWGGGRGGRQRFVLLGTD